MPDLEHLAQNLSFKDVQREMQTRSMHEFIKGAWGQLEPGRDYHDNWHIESICEHLEAVASSELRRLIINIPPRHMKSLTCAVSFPCWTWITQPNKQFLFASYAQSLSTRDSVKCRRLLSSSWYQENWGHSFKLTTDQNQKQRFENDQNGHRISTAVNAGVTGEGGDIIVIDDPHNVKQAESETIRNDTLDWWDTALPSRLNDPTTGAFVIIMQRVHQSDLTGHILKNEAESFADDLQTDPEAWTHLCVPAEYERNHPHFFKTTLAGAKYTVDPRKDEGELLWPNRFTPKALNNLKSSLGTYGSAGQLQQRPSPKGGGILKAKWWRKWEKDKGDPNYIYVVQSWDTAFSQSSTASYSACTTWGVFKHGGRYNIMLMHRYRERDEYPELRRKAKVMYQEMTPDAVLIEKKASGQSLLQDLRQAGIPAISYSPERDKISRAHSASAMLEAGLVWAPERNWAQQVINMCAIFPAGDGADIVDTCTQALIRLRAMWYADHPEDDTYDPEENREDREDPFDDNVVDIQRAYYG
tara:strand:- start:763 stop:2346 length:1584 start_codon:yes stop_codon:yes gene_type:complete